MASRSARSLTAEVDAALGPVPASYEQPEVVVLRFRRHGRRLLLPAIVLIAIAGLAGFWVGQFATGWVNLAAALGAALFALLLGVLPMLSWLAGRTTVTTRRVIVRRGLFVRHRTELALGRVREVRQRRSIGQRFWGAGNVELLHGAEKLVLDDVPGFAVTADALHELMERSFAHESRRQQVLGAQQYGVQQPGIQQPGAQPFGAGGFGPSAS
ncbi:PH domain-containing protein [Leucobacter chromiireducens]|uniref:PH domain-containing protein n=1 Tax=Leucobacter chromiireducens TaxID=283877 RepID=UPI001F14FD2B|nr:PH domain-containing protein [Leucobacter chromiireducens]